MRLFKKDEKELRAIFCHHYSPFPSFFSLRHRIKRERAVTMVTIRMYGVPFHQNKYFKLFTIPQNESWGSIFPPILNLMKGCFQQYSLIIFVVCSDRVEMGKKAEHTVSGNLVAKGPGRSRIARSRVYTLNIKFIGG